MSEADAVALLLTTEQMVEDEAGPSEPAAGPDAAPAAAVEQPVTKPKQQLPKALMKERKPALAYACEHKAAALVYTHACLACHVVALCTQRQCTTLCILFGN